MAAGAVSLRKSHDIVILSFCNIAKGQATYILKSSPSPHLISSFASNRLPTSLNGNCELLNVSQNWKWVLN